PAVNTPQPVRQRNKTGWLSQPVPPMFTPESIADSVLWVAEKMPREILLGWPTVRAVWGHRLFPSLADWYLARGGIESQLTDLPLAPDRRDILFGSVPRDPGAHGPFTDQERGKDWQMILRMNLRSAAVAAGVVVLGLFALLRRS